MNTPDKNLMSRRNRLKMLFLVFLLATAVALLDYLGQIFRLYWALWWFDLVMHFLGGLVVGLFLAWLYVFVLKKKPDGRLIWASVVGVIIIGSLWEIYEVFIGINVTHEPYVWDTTIDIILDITGAIIGSKYIKNQIEISNAK